MTAIVTCDRCGEQYRLVADTRQVNNFLQLMDVTIYTFDRQSLDPTSWPYFPRIYTRYNGKDYCWNCWRGYQNYKKKMQAKQEENYMLENKRQQEAKDLQVLSERQKIDQEEMYRNATPDEFGEYLQKVAPDVDPEHYVGKDINDTTTKEEVPTDLATPKSRERFVSLFKKKSGSPL